MIRRQFLSGERRYLAMQRDTYQAAARASRYEGSEVSDFVVGSYHEHNAWADYDDFIIGTIDGGPAGKVALDFGCGPGRNLIRYGAMFERMDGADISAANLRNARRNVAESTGGDPLLFETTGRDVGEAPASAYDFVMSVITLQHICSHSVRQAIFQDIARVLCRGGRFSAQMGFGEHPRSVPYRSDHYHARSTNGACDTRVESVDELAADLALAGLHDFQCWIRPTGPGDEHQHWIFFTVVKR